MTAPDAGGPLRCPTCNHDVTAVKDSRPGDDGAYIRRRRLCRGCGHKFTTYETLVEPETQDRATLADVHALRDVALRALTLADTLAERIDPGAVPVLRFPRHVGAIGRDRDADSLR